jgi:hypothetical protein
LRRLPIWSIIFIKSIFTIKQEVIFLSFDKSDSYFDILSHILRCNHIVDEKLLIAMKENSPKNKLPYKYSLEGNFDENIFVNNERNAIPLLSLAHIIQFIGENFKKEETEIYVLGCLYGYSLELLTKIGYSAKGYEVNSLLTKNVDECLLENISFGSIMPGNEILNGSNSLVVFEGFSNSNVMKKWSEKIPNTSFIGIDRISGDIGRLFYKKSINSPMVFKKDIIGSNITKPEMEGFSL